MTSRMMMSVIVRVRSRSDGQGTFDGSEERTREHEDKKREDEKTGSWDDDKRF